MIFVRIFLTGLVILVSAIALNVAAKGLGFSTWYDFLNQVADVGLAMAFRNLSFLDILFLVILYPFLLGLVAYLTIYWTRFF